MKIASFMMGAAIGAGLMYLLDPDRGAGRRAEMRDRALSMAHRTADAVDGKSRHVVNRTRGLVADLQAWRRAGGSPRRARRRGSLGDVEES